MMLSAACLSPPIVEQSWFKSTLGLLFQNYFRMYVPWAPIHILTLSTALNPTSCSQLSSSETSAGTGISQPALLPFPRFHSSDTSISCHSSLALKQACVCGLDNSTCLCSVQQFSKCFHVRCLIFALKSALNLSLLQIKEWFLFSQWRWGKEAPKINRLPQGHTVNNREAILWPQVWHLHQTYLFLLPFVTNCLCSHNVSYSRIYRVLPLLWHLTQ